MAPLKVQFWLARNAVGIVGMKVLPRLAEGAGAAAAGLLGRGAAALQAGRMAAAMKYVGVTKALSGVSAGLRTAEMAATIIRRGGVFGRYPFLAVGERIPGLLGTVVSYNRLGLVFGRTYTAAQVAAAQRSAEVAAWGTARGPVRTWLSGLRRTPGLDPTVALALSSRGRIEGDYRIVMSHQGHVIPGMRVRIDPTTVVEQLTPQQVSELTGIPVQELLAGNCQQVCSVGDFANNPAMHGGPEDGVLYVHEGKLYLDVRLIEGVRAGILSPDQLAGIVRSALDEAKHGFRGGSAHPLPNMKQLSKDLDAARAAAAPTHEGGAPDGPAPAGPARDPVQPAAPQTGNERATGRARPSTSDNGPDPLSGDAPGQNGQGAAHEEPAPAQTRPGEQRRPDPAADNLDKPPPAADESHPTPTTDQQEPAAGGGTDAGSESPYAAQIATVRSYLERLRRYTDEHLLTSYKELAGKVRRGEITVGEAVVECTAYACEATRRNQKEARPGQLEATLALSDEAIVKMLTGEGKTLAGALTAAVRAIDARDADGNPVAGKGVQWLVPSETHARAALAELQPIADRLGLTVDLLLPDQTVTRKRAAYTADIVIGPVNEFVFDRLWARVTPGEPVHQNRGGFRILDEVDQVLIDRATMPYIVSEDIDGAVAPKADLEWAARVAPHLEPGKHYEPSHAGTQLTDEGIKFVRSFQESTGMPAPEALTSRQNKALVRRIENALTAKRLQEEGRQYAREGNELVLIEHGVGQKNTRLGGGLQEAIEHLEQVEIGAPTREIARMTIREFLDGTPYAGMTGTPGDAKHYGGKSIVDIKRTGPVRLDLTKTYGTAREKWARVVEDIEQLHAEGRPILVLTGSIKDAVRLHRTLRDAGLESNLYHALTGKKAEERILAEGGSWGTITVATDRAGRGIDFKLGGDVEHLAKAIVEREHPGLITEDPVAYAAALDQAQKHAEWQTELERAELSRRGGLHVAITEFQPVQRIEDQGRGRAARDGDNGSATLYRSLEDHALQHPGDGELVKPGERTEPETGSRDPVAVDAFFEMSRREVAPSADAPHTIEQRRGSKAAKQERLGTVLTADQDGTPFALDGNPAGIDLPQLAAARAGQDIPSLTTAENEQLQQLAQDFAVEQYPTSQDQAVAAAAVAGLIPQRVWQPRRVTAVDLNSAVVLRQILENGSVAVERMDDLAERLGVSRADLAATIAAAARMQAIEGAEATDPVERLRLATFSERELQAFLDYVSGVPMADIADRLGVPVDGRAGIDWYLRLDAADPGVVLRKLTRATSNDAVRGGRIPAGRHVRSEESERAAAMREALAAQLLAAALGRDVDDIRQSVREEIIAAQPGIAEESLQRQVRDRMIVWAGEVDPDGLASGATVPALWKQVRQQLRATSDDLHPAERDALWLAPKDRLEELLHLLPGRYRDQVHQVLVAHGVTSVAQLAGLSRAQLRAFGLPARAARKIDRVLDHVELVEVSAQLRDRHVALDLAGRTDWTHDDLRAALRLAAELPPGTTYGSAELRAMLGIDRLGVLADVLIARREVGRAHAVVDLLVRARQGELTDAELADLVAYGSGVHQGPGADPSVGRLDRRVALLVLDAHVRALHGEPPAAPVAPARSSVVPAMIVAAPVGVGGGAGLAVVAGAGTAAVLASAAVGAIVVAAVTGTVLLLRNRGPPAPQHNRSGLAADEHIARLATTTRAATWGTVTGVVLVAALFIGAMAVVLAVPAQPVTLVIALFLGGYGSAVAVGVWFGAEKRRGNRRALQEAFAAAPVAGTAREALRRLAAAFGTEDGGDAAVRLVAAERALAMALAAAERVPGDAAAAADLHAAEAAHRRATEAVAEIAGAHLVDAVRLGVSDRRIGAALGVPTGVAAALTADARSTLLVASAKRPRGLVLHQDLRALRTVAAESAVELEAAWSRLAYAGAAVESTMAAIDETRRYAIGWLSHPQGWTATPEQLPRIAARLGIPLAVVQSLATDPHNPTDVPPAVGRSAGKHHTFEKDLKLVEATLRRLRATLDRAIAMRAEAGEGWAAAAATHRATIEEGVREARAAGRSVGAVSRALGMPYSAVTALDPGGRRAVGAGLGTYPPGSPLLRPTAVEPARTPEVPDARRGGAQARAPPWERRALGSRRALRSDLRTELGLWNAWQELDRAAFDLQAHSRAVREELIADAGGLATIGPAGLAAIGAAVQAAVDADQRSAAARAAFVDAIRPAVDAAARRGLPPAAIMKWTGLDWPIVSELTGLARPDPTKRNQRWDRVFFLWMRLWEAFHPGETFELPDGQVVSTRWFQRMLRQGAMPEDVDERIAGLIGKNRLHVHDLSDAHNHHVGYDDPRTTSIKDFLQRLADAGHQGVITFHPIPQRGKGLASAGGTFYYATVNSAKTSLLLGVPMLRMWGTFPDVRLVTAVRNLPRHLKWRAVMGVTGARLDIPGAEGYLQVMAVLNPDLAVMVGETTIAKEAVRDLLGEQGIHILNPAWERQVRLLISAAGLVRRLVADPAELPAALRELGRRPVAELLGALLDEIDTVRAVLREHGRADFADQLLSHADLKALPAHNPDVAEELKASQEVGYLTVLHNDWGLARILADGQFGEEVPDERYGMPLLALLKQFPGAKVILAHLGVGKWTTLSVEHLRLIDRILGDPDYRHVSFDISWNEVARHLQATPEITDEFLRLVRRHPTRIVFGSDAVKSESNEQYFRHAHDLEPIFRRIRAEVGLVAFHNVRHDNLERLLEAAQSDVQRWSYVQLTSGAWDEFRRKVGADRNAVIDRWLWDYELAHGPPTQAERDAIEIVDVAELTRSDRPGATQVGNLLLWSNAVDAKVAAGRLITPKLTVAAVRAWWAETKVHYRAWVDRRRDRRLAAEGLDLATDAEGLGLTDADGSPWTVEALIAAHQSLEVTRDAEIAEQVLKEVQRTELAQRADKAEIERRHKAYRTRTRIAMGITLAVLVAGSPLLLALPPITASWAFAVRGALNVQRVVYSQQLRVMTESILERGQFDRRTVRALIGIIGKYAALDRMDPSRLSRFDELALQTIVDAEALIEAPLGEESAQSRFETSLKEFSIFLDKAGSIFGIQAQSLYGFSPNAGLLGKVVSTAIAGSFVVNLAVHMAATHSAAFGSFAWWMNGTFALSDVLFLTQALPAAIAGWLGYDVNLLPRIRKITQAFAMPVITVANFLLSLHAGFVDHSPMVLAAIGLTVSSAYLSWLGIAAELGLGRIQPRKGVTANLVMATSLLAYGLAAVLPTQWVPAALAAVVGAGALVAVSKIDSQRARAARGPPPAGRTRAATAADLPRIAQQAIVHPDGHGVVLVARGDPLRAYGLELRTAPGQMTVVVHADADGFRYVLDGVWVRLTGAQLGEVLGMLDLPRRAAEQELVLCACSVGARPGGPVRELSRSTGSPVVAATSTVTVVTHPRLGSRVESGGGWVRVSGAGPAQEVHAPPALVAPITVIGAQRIGPPGVRLPIAPRAPPVTAGGLAPRDRMRVAEQVREHGYRSNSPGRPGFFDDPVARATFLMMTPQERTDYVTSAGWTQSALGFAVERIGDDVVASTLGPDDELFTNLTLTLIAADGTERALPDIDWLVLGALRSISGKTSKARIKKRNDFRYLRRLLDADLVPADGPMLRQFLRDDPTIALSDAVIDTIERVDVRWGDGRSLPLDIFRGRHLRGVPGPAAFRLESLTPAQSGADGLHLPYTKAEIVAAIVDVIRRELREPGSGVGAPVGNPVAPGDAGDAAQPRLPAAIVVAELTGVPVYLHSDDARPMSVGLEPDGWDLRVDPDGTVRRRVGSDTQPVPVSPSTTTPLPRPQLHVPDVTWDDVLEAAAVRPDPASNGVTDGLTIAGHYRRTMEVSDDELTTLIQYAGVHYSLLNKWLRGQGPDDAETRVYVTALISTIDAIMERYRLPATAVLHRGIGDGVLPAGPLAPGTVFVDPAYTSTSYGPYQPWETELPGFMDRPTQLTITAPVGLPAISMDGAGIGSIPVDDVYDDSEKEILLPRGTRLVVETDFVQDGQRHVHAVALAPAGTTRRSLWRRVVGGVTGMLGLAVVFATAQTRPAAAVGTGGFDAAHQLVSAPVLMAAAVAVAGLLLLLVRRVTRWSARGPPARAVFAAALAVLVTSPLPLPLWARAGVAAAALVSVAGRARAARARAAAWAETLAGWAEIGAQTTTPATPAGVLAQVLRRHLAGEGTAPHEFGGLAEELVAAGLLRIRETPDGPVLVPAGPFAGLWARAPPQLQAALTADPTAVLPEAGTERSAADLADAVLERLRTAAWEQQEVRPGLRSRLPLVGAARARLKAVMAPLRAISREIDGIVAELIGPRRLLADLERARDDLDAAAHRRRAAMRRLDAALRDGRGVLLAAVAYARAGAAHRRLLRRLPPELRHLRPDQAVAALTAQVREIQLRLAEAQDRERAAAAEASSAAAAAGSTRREVVAARMQAMLGMSRHMARVNGWFAALPGQTAGAHTVASGPYGDHYHKDASWVTAQGAASSSAATVAGLVAALLGDRPIRSMTTIVSLGGAASIALVVIGLLPVPALFVPAVMAVGVMGIAGAMARGRMERYHPAAGEAKDVREGQYESAFKFAGFVLPIFIPQSAEKVGVTFTSVVLGVLTAVSTLAVWMVLRGEGAAVQPRAPPAIRETLRGGIAQIIATPRGLLRALASVPLFTLVTGLYATSLGGVMIDQIVTVNDPTHAVFTTATAVTVLVTVRGFVAQFVGPLWAPVKRLLGTPLGRSAPGTVIDESRVLTGVANLAFVLAAPLAWYVLAPGLVSFGAVLTVGAIVSSFARLPTGRWKEGGTGAALNLTAKAGSNALAAVLMAFALGDVAARVTGRVNAGLPYADLVAATNHRLVLLAVPILFVPALLARAIAALRAGPLDTLRDRLVITGLDVAAAAGITGKLSARGVDDIGSARALFVDDGWAPRWAARWRNGLRAQRQRSVGLTAAELTALLDVLDAPTRGPGRA